MADTEGPTSSSDSDVRLARQLAEVLADTGLTEIEIERGDLKIRVARQAAAVPSTVYAAAPPAHAPAAPATPASASAESAPVRGDTVKSPMVGTVYLQAQPGAAPFARAGDTVSEGQTLLLIEAMKTMNPIVAPRAGKIVEILVGDSQPVEYGEPLAIIA